MDETARQTDKDSDVIIKDCECDEEPQKDISYSETEGHATKKSSNDAETSEESAGETNSFSSNGIHNEVINVKTIPSDTNLPSEAIAVDVDEVKSNSEHETSLENVDHGEKSESGDPLTSPHGNSVQTEDHEQPIPVFIDEANNEKNESFSIDSEDLTENNSVNSVEINNSSENTSVNKSEQSHDVNVNQGESTSENTKEIKNLPYKCTDSVKNVDFLDMSLLKDDLVDLTESKESNSSENNFNLVPDAAEAPERVNTEVGLSSCVGLKPPGEKDAKEIQLNSLESDVPMDVEMKQQTSDDVEEPEEDVLAFKCNEALHNIETDAHTDTDAVESNSKDPHSNSECVQDDNFSPTNKFASQNELQSTTPDDKVEILNTEVVNCNDESPMDISENEKEVEVNNIDVDQSVDLDKKNDGDEMDVDKSGECENSDRDDDKKEKSSEEKDQLMTIEEIDAEKQMVSLDENEALIQPPGGSAEETITGDTTNDRQINDTRGKDAEVCIIPDDVNPRLAVPSQTNEEKDKKGNSEKKPDDTPMKEVIKTQKVTAGTQEIDKSKEKDETSGEAGVKSRPVRVAAKLAGNKIKTLVQNDLAPETLSPKRVNDETETDETTNSCVQCSGVKTCKFQIIQDGHTRFLCSDQCYNQFQKTAQPELDELEPGAHLRKCAQCLIQVTGDENTLSWETMDFCNEECLGKYQTELGSNCANCKGNVASVSLGKYCVRFGYDVKQFCSSSCLEEYKKGLKVCSYCQKDISSGTEGFLAPVGDKGQFKDFCTQSCMEKYEQMSNNTPPPSVIAECAVCSNSKPVKVEVELDNKTQKLCSEPCFAAFKFVNNITEGQCDMCKKYFDKMKTGNFSIYYEDAPHSFCCKTCMNVYILANRKIVPCNWCKVKKYNFDMIKKTNVSGQALMICSLNCLTLYQVSVNAVSSRRTMCDFCLSFSKAKYHLTMSDATVRNFCSYACVMSFQQNQYPKQSISLPATERLTSPIPTGGPKKILPRRSQVTPTPGVPVISSVQSLASPNGPVSSARVPIPATEVSLVSQVTSISQPITIQPTVPAMEAPPPPQIYQQIITKPAPVKQQKNKSVLCKPYSHTKGVSCRPHPCMKETQTDESLNRKYLIPVPVPIYVPAPMHMFATPFPIAVPFPLPVPVPIFIPTTRNSAKGIFKEIKKIQEKIPTDPFEAELLMMAEMVAGEKKQDPTDSESDEGGDGDDGGDGTFSPENVDTSNAFGEDMLQMALKMATELEEPAVDMESVLTSNTITPSSQPTVDPNKGLYVINPDDPDQVQVMPMNRGRKRSMRGGRNSTGGSQSKRGRRISGSNVDVPMLPPPEPVPPPRIEVEKPDANMCLKYTFGVNAWRHWVMQKNAELEKAAMTNRKIKLFKPELLQLTADELNFSLCLFVKEVRKPNGTEYAPDTIYYLCLGIQQYLFENGRIDNIFTDSYYEKFTDCLDEVAKKFAAIYSDSQYIVTRVEEEHLWESKQLGAHSPHVLLSTLMFFNTKHFNLVTVEEHMQLSFSHIMKHWKRNPNAPGVAKVPGSRNVLLRFYPPQSALEANSRKKKVYEQQENEENPLRCPVKLYEFYLSKCPESVKTRNDVFYLLPERSCVPDSPVWYSTMALGKEPLTKMLHRVKMVKEINIALLTC